MALVCGTLVRRLGGCNASWVSRAPGIGTELVSIIILASVILSPAATSGQAPRRISAVASKHEILRPPAAGVSPQTGIRKQNVMNVKCNR